MINFDKPSRLQVVRSRGKVRGAIIARRPWIASSGYATEMEALSRAGGNGGGQPGQGQTGGQRGGGQSGQTGNARGGQAGPGGNGLINGYNDGGYAGGRYGYGDIGSLTPLTGTERQPTPVTQADIQRAYQNAIQELNDLQRSVQGQPEPLADISELLKEMQQLDPRRFPGNPAMLEAVHGRVARHRRSA